MSKSFYVQKMHAIHLIWKHKLIAQNKNNWGIRHKQHYSWQSYRCKREKGKMIVEY